MSETVFSEEFLISRVDGVKDRYLIEYPREQRSDLLVVFLHAGLSKAKQAFCEDKGWCFSSLRDEVMRRNGVYISPEYRGDSWMNASAEADLAELIRDVKEHFGVSRVVLTGASMGATAALIFASHHPEMIDGLAVLCPVTDMRKLYSDMKIREELMYKHIAKSIVRAYGGSPSKIPDEYNYRSSILNASSLKMPVAIRHGEADDVVPIAHSRVMVEALRAQGTPVRYDIISGGDHAAPTVNPPWREYLDFVLSAR